MNARAPISPYPEKSAGSDAAASPRGAMQPGSRADRGEVRISIERLGIEGFPLTSRQSARVRHAVERELVRLLQAQPLRSRNIAVAGLRAPSLPDDIGTDAEAFGVEIARSLFAAMRSEASEDER